MSVRSEIESTTANGRIWTVHHERHGQGRDLLVTCPFVSTPRAGYYVHAIGCCAYYGTYVIDGYGMVKTCAGVLPADGRLGLAQSGYEPPTEEVLTELVKLGIALPGKRTFHGVRDPDAVTARVELTLRELVCLRSAARALRRKRLHQTRRSGFVPAPGRRDSNLVYAEALEQAVAKLARAVKELSPLEADREPTVEDR